MALMVPILAFVCVFALMVWLLLDPSSLQNLMQSAVRADARQAPPRYPHFPVIVIFATGIGFFYELGRSGVLHSIRPPDTLQFYLLVVATLFFAVCGVGACYWPIAFQRVFNSRLRHTRDLDLPQNAVRALAISGKCWGVLMLVACSYFAHVLAAK
jgi:hypothetical protein